MVIAIKIRMNLCFAVANNVVPDEDILDMHNIDNMITESEMHGARIWFHCIAWALKICLENLNQLNNGFTWMKYFTQGCHKMSKASI